MKLNHLDNLPQLSGKPIAVRIHPAAERALKSGHPWVYSDSIIKQSRRGSSGDIAVLFDRKNRFMAVGLLDPDSPIAVRILQSGQPTAINRAFFQQALENALEIRNPLIQSPENLNTTGFRILNGENDGMPGLVLDRYGDVLVLKLYTTAWLPHLQYFLSALQDVLEFEHLVLRTDQRTTELTAETGLKDGAVLTPGKLHLPVLFKENGLIFEADPVYGQKTGFFLDQRENRARLQSLAKNHTILNLYSYTGGFSVYAARGGARSIVDVDTCSEAADAAYRNMDRNRSMYPSAIRHKVLKNDVFQALAEFAERGSLFDIVIADPPAFARNRQQVDHALEMYARLTRSCLRVLRPGGILVQASCSSPVLAEDFYDTISTAAESANRPLHDIKRTGQPLDHPASFEQGYYLKCLFARAA